MSELRTRQAVHQSPPNEDSSDFRDRLANLTERPNARSIPLPPYRGIVAVDAKDFTGHQAIEHGTISAAIPQLLQTSYERAGLSEVWEDRRFPNSTGDGYVFGFDPSVMPLVIHPWLRTLQDLLAEFHVQAHGAVRIRLRVSLHIGPLPDSGGDHDGNGTARNDTHRLLDSRPVKAMLAAASENVTHVAAVLSDRCYQDAVASGYTGRHTDLFIEAPATVEGKRFAQRAWLYVPEPSGNLYDPRVLGGPAGEGQHDTADPVGTTDSPAPDPTPAPPSTVVNRADQGFVNAGTVQGGQHLHNDGGRHR